MNWMDILIAKHLLRIDESRYDINKDNLTITILYSNGRYKSILLAVFSY